MRKILRWLFTTSPTAADVGLLVSRLSVGLLLAFAHGVDKVRNVDAFVVQVDKLNMANAQVLGVCAVLAEFVGGLLLAVGLFSRGAAVAILVTMGVAAFQVHGADPFAKQELAILYGLGALALAVAGPGRLSLDHLLFGRRAGMPAAPESAGATAPEPELEPEPEPESAPESEPKSEPKSELELDFGQALEPDLDSHLVPESNDVLPTVTSTADWLGPEAARRPVPPPTPLTKTKDTVVAKRPKR